MKILVTGATGYIGGRLVPLLLAEGHQVRVLVRDKRRLEARSWMSEVEVVEGSVEERSVVADAVRGMDSAYYLVHSMCSDPESPHFDTAVARAFSEAAKGIPQVIYLGGILPAAAWREVPLELRSRAEVGEILASELPTTEVRAGPIIGSGSASFEMVRFSTERSPAILGPSWIKNLVQPIAVRDVLAYLVAAVGRKDTLGVMEVGSEPLTFKKMMLDYADVRGLHRAFLSLPVKVLGLSAWWIGLVTPIPHCLAARLVRGLKRPVIGDTARSRRLFPEIKPVSYRRAVELALERTHQRDVKTRWSDALGRRETSRLKDQGGLAREVRTCLVNAPPEAVFGALSSLGGDRGWLVWNWAWRLRGLLDQVVGGPGLRRGRRDPSELLPGEAVDFWRVEEVDAPHLLRLRAEMKVPGRAWLQWETREERGQTRLIQTALFEPKGLFGWAYWHGSYPFHGFIFDGMVDAIAALALEGESEEPGQIATT
jgi:uncharacterized protein YbjT (DUF2867 family)